MAKCEMDPCNLKSFQKISHEDLRYLKELGKAAALAAADRKPEPEPFSLRMLPRRIINRIHELIDNLFYETVPANEVYASRD